MVIYVVSGGVKTSLTKYKRAVSIKLDIAHSQDEKCSFSSDKMWCDEYINILLKYTVALKVAMNYSELFYEMIFYE